MHLPCDSDPSPVSSGHLRLPPCPTAREQPETSQQPNASASPYGQTLTGGTAEPHKGLADGRVPSGRRARLRALRGARLRGEAFARLRPAIGSHPDLIRRGAHVASPPGPSQTLWEKFSSPVPPSPREKGPDSGERGRAGRRNPHHFPGPALQRGLWASPPAAEGWPWPSKPA